MPIFSRIAGDGIGLPRCAVRKLHHLPTDLQIRHIAVEIDPIQALQIQAHVPVEVVPGLVEVEVAVPRLRPAVW